MGEAGGQAQPGRAIRRQKVYKLYLAIERMTASNKKCLKVKFIWDRHFDAINFHHQFITSIVHCICVSSYLFCYFLSYDNVDDAMVRLIRDNF